MKRLRNEALTAAGVFGARHLASGIYVVNQLLCYTLLVDA